MDYTSLIGSTKESHELIRSIPLDSRVIAVGADPIPALMLTAYEHINPGLKLVAVCTEANDVYGLIESQNPSTAIICADLESGDGITLACELKNKFTDLRLMLIGRSLRHEPYIPLWRGDCEVIALRQRSGGGRLFKAFHTLFVGGSYCDPYLQELLLKTCKRRKLQTPTITSREIDIILALVSGLSNSAISLRLHLSEDTVKKYISVLLDKLNCQNRCQLATRALRLGLCSWGMASSGDDLLPDLKPVNADYS